MNPPVPSVRTIFVKDIPTAAPQLRFATRLTGGRGDQENADPWARPGVQNESEAPRPDFRHDADEPHSLAGVGKLFFALAVARLADQDDALLTRPITLRAEHRQRARAGTLRSLTSELTLSLGDALSLVIGTGDAACALAVLEDLDAQGIDAVAEAQRSVGDLGLGATSITATEPSVEADGASWGEGLGGETTSADLCMLLDHLVAASLVPDTAHTVLGWMATVFEPAGLASALPGFGPRTVPHRTVSGFELLAPAGAPGCASVLVLPADVGNAEAGRVGSATCVAAYHPAARDDGTFFTAREVSAAHGTLGLAVHMHSRRPVE